MRRDNKGGLTSPAEAETYMNAARGVIDHILTNRNGAELWWKDEQNHRRKYGLTHEQETELITKLSQKFPRPEQENISMVNVNQVYGTGKYLKAEDLQNQKHVVTISAVRTVTYDDGKVKLVLSFAGKDKDLVLNKTNSTNVMEMYGPETDHWVNRNITLYSAFVDFQGKTVPAVRIEPLVPGAPSGMQAQAPVQQPAPVQNDGQQFAQQPLTPANEVHSAPASENPFPPQQTPFDDEIPF